MTSFKLAALRTRYGTLCALASLALLSSPFASAGTSLSISGTPSATASVGSAYSFQPTASVPSGLKGTFEVFNMPSWATFNSSTGRLSGTPSASNVGTYRWVQIAINDGKATSWLPSYTLTVSAASSGSGSSTGSGSGSTFSISGTPSTTASVGTTYSFQPKATIPAGTTATFTVYNMPSWMSFSSTTGKLSGTPTANNIGTYRWLQISASNGKSTSWLPSYTLTVSGSSSSPPPSTGTVTISWAAPTENTNGTALTNLAGYHLYYGTNQSSLTNVVNITNPGLATYVLSNLTATTWYFAMSSVNSTGQEGPRSSVLSHLVQ